MTMKAPFIMFPPDNRAIIQIWSGKFEGSIKTVIAVSLASAIRPVQWPLNSTPLFNATCYCPAT